MTGSYTSPSPSGSSNEHAKACCLPPELTIEIFLETRRIWPPFGLLGKYKYTPGWMTVLHVCSAWRRVALSAPILWQSIEALRVHPKSLADLLARSFDLPLHLTLDALYPDEMVKMDDKLLSVCFNEPVFRRLESLAVRHGSPKIYKALSHQLSLGAPSLQRLGLYHDDYPSHTALLSGSHLTCPPQLRRLDLYNCAVPPDFPLFASTLTHLNLKYVHGSHLISVKGMLSFLSALSSLEYIDLHIPKFSDAGSTSLQRITMPSELKYMFLHVYPSTLRGRQAMDLISHLSVPATTDMHVVLNRIEETNVTEQLFYSLFASDLASGHVMELEIRLGCLDDYEDMDYICSLYVFNPKIQAYKTRRLDLARESYVDLITKYPPRSLILSRDYLSSLATRFDVQHCWDDEFGAARDARHLSICFLDHQLLWLLLAENLPSAFLPLLDTLILTSTSRHWVDAEYAYKAHMLDFVKKMPAVVQHDIEASVLSDLVNGLVKAVELRRHSGKPLREVRIDRRLARWNVWDEVRAVVDVVVV